MIAGYSQQTKGAFYKWKNLFQEAEQQITSEPEKKTFTPKNPELMKLDDYRGEFPEEFWVKFPSHKKCPAEPTMNLRELDKLVQEVGITDKNRLSRVRDRIINGAEIGCRGTPRCPTVSKNAKSAYKFGEQVSDALASLVKKKYVYGPIREEELPANAKISGIMVREKPDGSVRVILNLSAPEGMSVNDGIDSSEFPAKMSSTEEWLKVLNKAGRGAWIAKTDWADAYKQIHVAEEDTDLQYFEWGGMYFKELCLIFGSASSAGIFDDSAKTVLDIVQRKAKADPEMSCQHLDDMASACQESSQDVHRLDREFKETARRLGVKLAPTDDPEKAFGPSKKGIVFGVMYDTVNWTWEIPEKKKVKYINSIAKAINSTSCSPKEIKSLAGKLLHIKPLIPAGRFNIDKIMRALADSDKMDEIEITTELRQQLQFWLTCIKACSSRLSIPKISQKLPPWRIEAYTDAAGGTSHSPGRGTGGVVENRWFYMPWSKKVNAGVAKVEGKKVSRKLSALELIGPLIITSTNVDLCANRPLAIWVDNAGSVGVWRKGYSNSCPLCNTIVKATSTVSAAIGCKLEIMKVARCSNTGAIIADHLSKAEFREARQIATDNNIEMNLDPLKIPQSILKWACNPQPDDQLGARILEEIAKSREILGYNI